MSIDADYFKFTVPPGMGAAQILAEYRDLAMYLDVYVLDSAGEIVGFGEGIGDGQRANVVVTPGETLLRLPRELGTASPPSTT